jgi:hypothetical protein
VLARRAIQRDPDAWLLAIPTGLYYGFFFLYNLALLLSQAGWIVMPDALLEPLPLPPFTMHWQILVDLIFLAALLAFLIRRFTQARQGEERYTTQLEAARQVQHLLLPEAIPQVAGFAIDPPSRSAATSSRFSQYRGWTEKPICSSSSAMSPERDCQPQ